MKKTLFALLSMGMIATSMTSCKKTNTRKFSNEWKVTHEETNGNYSEGGISTTTATVFEETTVTASTTQMDSNGTTTYAGSGTVQTNDFTINNDGTWSRLTKYQLDGEEFNEFYEITLSGTWSFIGKSKSEDFRRNDRVVFYVLSENQDHTFVNNSTNESTPESLKRTFAMGEYPLVYNIKSSKRKELELEMEGESQSTSNLSTPASIGHHTWSKKLTLKEK